ncbi:outer membrane beta-barrel protein [Helicobacter felis]|uniref:outer membrane beta-barrel protein n=1 Tax=Helicobacter felis TaxID=214 RepID=UPI001F271559|nr:outer membrane beta-barrel protein [Helicobacter felis]
MSERVAFVLASGLALFSYTSLNAEGNGGFLGLGFQYSVAQSTPPWLTKKGQPVDLTRVAMFQLMINAGVRTNISAHQGVEVGVRVPVIPYRSYAIGRVVAVFANYVVNF